MQQLTGRADFYLNGVFFDTTQEGSSISTLSGFENTPIVGSRGTVIGFTTKGTPAQIKVVVPHGPDFDIATFSASGLAIEFACDNGPTYQMVNAIFMKDDGLDPSKGTATLTYTGDVVRV